MHRFGCAPPPAAPPPCLPAHNTRPQVAHYNPSHEAGDVVPLVAAGVGHSHRVPADIPRAGQGCSAKGMGGAQAGGCGPRRTPSALADAGAGMGRLWGAPAAVCCRRGEARQGASPFITPNFFSAPTSQQTSHSPCTWGRRSAFKM